MRLGTVSPEDAEKLWCPAVRDCSSGVVNGNSQCGTREKFSPCISTRCMMWRWEEGLHIDPRDGQPTVQMSNNEWRPARGYCGLGGVPLP